MGYVFILRHSTNRCGFLLYCRRLHQHKLYEPTVHIVGKPPNLPKTLNKCGSRRGSSGFRHLKALFQTHRSLASVVDAAKKSESVKLFCLKGHMPHFWKALIAVDITPSYPAAMSPSCPNSHII
ncbi:unnamed protein product [Leptosia nina]|uniref:Uncharacterized protein n=1 Tax=Leptosia nina TaxID=320188 RepID=A0AAV1JED1_9NEOP